MRLFQLNTRSLLNTKPLYNIHVYKRLYNTGLLRKTSTLPDKVGLCLSKEQGNLTFYQGK